MEKNTFRIYSQNKKAHSAYKIHYLCSVMNCEKMCRCKMSVVFIYR